MEEDSKIRKIAFVGDHLPRKCGIATFTSDLLAAVAAAHPQSQCFSVSVNDIPGGYEYPEVVRFEIEEQDLSSYLRAADFLNISDVDIVCLQHEFGIFGGTAGGHILALLRELRMPVVTTLHTILREPKTDQRRVTHELVALSTRLVVMADRGRQMLQEIYQAPPAKIDLIPHGIPDVGLELYSPKTCGCRDGLQVDRVNRSQGAESTLAFLLSLAEMRLAQNTLTSFKEPIAA